MVGIKGNKERYLNVSKALYHDISEKRNYCARNTFFSLLLNSYTSQRYDSDENHWHPCNHASIRANTINANERTAQPLGTSKALGEFLDGGRRRTSHHVDQAGQGNAVGRCSRRPRAPRSPDRYRGLLSSLSLYPFTHSHVRTHACSLHGFHLKDFFFTLSK